MKYQLIKHNKTSHKTIAILDSIEQIKELINKMDLQFDDFSYVGGFPLFNAPIKGNSRPLYSVQGLSQRFNIVCSLDEDDKKELSHD